MEKSAISLIDQVKNFVTDEVLPSLASMEMNMDYPYALVERMKSLGLFGMTIPKEYGGKAISLQERIQIIEELAVGWLSLCSLLDSHSRVCDYLVEFGTVKQKSDYLPLLADGKLIAAHANNEDNEKEIERYETCLVQDLSRKCWYLSGRKEWVTNAKNADLVAVSVRLIPTFNTIKSAVVILKTKDVNGLIVEDDWNRMGIHGVSLAPITFNSCVLKIHQILGELEHDGRVIIDSAKLNLLMVSSARSIGSCRVLIDKCGQHLVKRKRNSIHGTVAENPIVQAKFGSMFMQFQAAKSLYDNCCLKINSQITNSELAIFLSCKVFTSITAEQLALSCMKLAGGSGYTAKHGIERMVRDVLSLSIIHTSNDIALTIAGKSQLDKCKKLSSMMLTYSTYIKPKIDYEILLRASLGEQEKIIDAGYYHHAHLYLYDMTSLNPSQTFKDLIGCLTFAHCLQNNINHFCAQSSGNTGMSLICYARKIPEVKVTLFYLEDNAYKINTTNLPPNVTIVQVNTDEKTMKEYLKRFSDLTNVPILPTMSLQLNANKVRAYYLNDHYFKKNQIFHWYVQSLSSAYGPFGLYQGFEELCSLQQIPKLLGIQQQAVCPYFRVFGSHLEYENMINEPKKVSLIEPTLFRSDPGDQLLDKMRYILDTHGGKIKMVTNKQYSCYKQKAIELLASNQIIITPKRENIDDYQEKAGLLAVAGVLHELDQVDSVILEDQHVLIGITGGTRPAPVRLPQPHHILQYNATEQNLKNLLQ